MALMPSAITEGLLVVTNGGDHPHALSYLHIRKTGGIWLTSARPP